MKGLFRVLALALIVAMLASPVFAAAEGSLLAGRMIRAYEAGRRVEVVMSVKAGVGLQLSLPAETLSAIEKLLQDVRIVAHWAKDGEGNPAMGLLIHIGQTEVLSGTAVLTAEGAAVNTSLLPGKTVLVPHETLTDLAARPLPVSMENADRMAALLAQAYETYFGILMGWVQENEGMMEPVEGPIPGTGVRSEAESGMKLQASAQQLKELLVRLTGKFVQDTGLQVVLQVFFNSTGNTELSAAALARALSKGAKQLEPTSGALKLGAYVDADGNLVGLDLEMDALFADMPESPYARYDRLDGDGQLAYDFQGWIGLEDAGQLAVMVNYSEEESHTENKLTQDMLLRGMIQQTGTDPVNQITLTDKRETTLNAGQEHLTDVLEFTMESLAPDGSQPDDMGMTLSAALRTQSVTNERAGDDFDADVSVTVEALGMEFATLYLHFASDEYVAGDASGNAVIDLAKATPEEQEALTGELQTGLGMAITAAMGAFPPELLAMMGMT